jgi:hypothetical protein
MELWLLRRSDFANQTPIDWGRNKQESKDRGGWLTSPLVELALELAKMPELLLVEGLMPSGALGVALESGGDFVSVQALTAELKMPIEALTVS